MEHDGNRRSMLMVLGFPAATFTVLFAKNVENAAPWHELRKRCSFPANVSQALQFPSSVAAWHTATNTSDCSVCEMSAKKPKIWPSKASVPVFSIKTQRTWSNFYEKRFSCNGTYTFRKLLAVRNSRARTYVNLLECWRTRQQWIDLCACNIRHFCLFAIISRGWDAYVCNSYAKPGHGYFSSENCKRVWISFSIIC